MVAVIMREPDADWFEFELSRADVRTMCTASVLELGIVLESRRPQAVGIARRVLRDARIDVVSFDDDLAERAMHAWRRFGKGRHKAALNFGDCFTYALAERDRLPILCAGTDFARTDLDVLTPPKRRR